MSLTHISSPPLQPKDLNQDLLLPGLGELIPVPLVALNTVVDIAYIGAQ